MRLIRTRKRLTLFLGVASVVALVAAGTAYALTASSFTYSSPKTGYVRLSPLAFAPDGSGGTYANDWTTGLAATGGACLNAGVDLPVGSRVKAIAFYYRSGPASDFYGDFRRMQLSTQTSLSLANVNPNNNAGTPATVTKSIAAVNQPVTAGRAYGVGVCTGNDGSFFGARIKYTYTSAGS